MVKEADKEQEVLTRRAFFGRSKELAVAGLALGTTVATHTTGRIHRQEYVEENLPSLGEPIKRAVTDMLDERKSSAQALQLTSGTIGAASAVGLAKAFHKDAQEREPVTDAPRSAQRRQLLIVVPAVTGIGAAFTGMYGFLYTLGGVAETGMITKDLPKTSSPEDKRSVMEVLKKTSAIDIKQFQTEEKVMLGGTALLAVSKGFAVNEIIRQRSSVANNNRNKQK